MLPNKCSCSSNNSSLEYYIKFIQKPFLFIADPWRDFHAIQFLKLSTRERRSHYKCRNNFLTLKSIETFPEMEKRYNNLNLDRKFITVTEIPLVLKNKKQM